MNKKSNKYDNVLIICSTPAEKVSALFTLHALSGKDIYNESLDSTNFDEYPNVTIAGHEVMGTSRRSDKYIAEGGIIAIPFSKIHKLDEIIDKAVPVRITLEGGQYTAVISKDGIKVGCQKISFAKLDEINAAAKKFRE